MVQVGRSITVSGRHYANAVPDELFNKAAQNAAQHAAESRGVEKHGREDGQAGSVANLWETAISGPKQHISKIDKPGHD